MSSPGLIEDCHHVIYFGQVLSHIRSPPKVFNSSYPKFHCWRPSWLLAYVVYVDYTSIPHLFTYPTHLIFRDPFNANRHSCPINSSFLSLLPILLSSNYSLPKLSCCLELFIFFKLVTDGTHFSKVIPFLYLFPIKKMKRSCSSSSSESNSSTSSSSSGPIWVPAPIVPLWVVHDNKSLLVNNILSVLSEMDVEHMYNTYHIPQDIFWVYTPRPNVYDDDSISTEDTIVYKK